MVIEIELTLKAEPMLPERDRRQGAGCTFQASKFHSLALAFLQSISSQTQVLSVATLDN